jgi:hypothetical protein
MLRGPRTLPLDGDPRASPDPGAIRPVPDVSTASPIPPIGAGEDPDGPVLRPGGFRRLSPKWTSAVHLDGRGRVAVGTRSAAAYPASMAIVVPIAAGAFGRATVSTPFLKAAVTFDPPVSLTMRARDSRPRGQGSRHRFVPPLQVDSRGTGPSPHPRREQSQCQEGTRGHDTGSRQQGRSGGGAAIPPGHRRPWSPSSDRGAISPSGAGPPHRYDRVQRSASMIAPDGGPDPAALPSARNGTLLADATDVVGSPASRPVPPLGTERSAACP